MNYVRCIKAASLLVVLVMFIGCKSKQDKPGASTGTPQEKAAAPAAVPSQDKSGTPDVSPQDKADARAAAVRVLALMESGDFSGIYKDAAAGFKQLGSESQFVAKFQQTRKNVGVLKNPQEISFRALPGNGYVFIYRLENGGYKTDVRLTFARSQSKKMELVGLNQHDELKK
jgi:ABC-type enterochelin transport system substrate-binding protein